MQSYLQTSSITITPFTHRNINLKSTDINKYDNAKQTRALIPNLLYSLDATSLVLLYSKFCIQYKDVQFFSIHDCFGTTADKIFSVTNFN